MSGGVLLNQDHQDRRRGQQRDRIFDLESPQGILCCPDCRSGMVRGRDSLVCDQCGVRCRIVKGALHCIDKTTVAEHSSSESWLNVLKNKLKLCPGLYAFLTNTCSPMMPSGKGAKTLLNRLSPDAVILNLGSGTRRISRSVINVDFLPFAGVDVVADVTRLPFKDNSIDGIISEAALEHVRHCRAAFDEMHRALKKGGYLYLVVPFIVGYHPSPNDYRRWTVPGIIDDLGGFEVVESGIRGGPTSALLWILQEWLAMALSFNIKSLYRGYGSASWL